jgi:RNA polymerase sigma-70 factor, ECF subfamily
MNRSYMNRERAGHILQTSALVHEAYTRLIDTPRVNWQDRSHFFAVCSTLMRLVLVDHTRSRANLKRGGGVKLLSLEEARAIGHDGEVDLFALDEALTALAAIDPRKSQVVEALHTSPDTVICDWKLSKSWLLCELKSEQPRGSGNRR